MVWKCPIFRQSLYCCEGQTTCESMRWPSSDVISFNLRITKITELLFRLKSIFKTPLKVLIISNNLFDQERFKGLDLGFIQGEFHYILTLTVLHWMTFWLHLVQSYDLAFQSLSVNNLQSVHTHLTKIFELRCVLCSNFKTPSNLRYQLIHQSKFASRMP